MLDFKEIKDGTQFEIFIRELLIAYGLRAYWSGVGPDDGKDLLCIEPQKSFFENSEKKWLVSCKHYASSNNSVGINDLGEITDLCKQHGATGYILICSTQPSAAVVTRLEEISKRGEITAIYWDAAKIELMISTPKLWRIAQKFMPISSESKKLNVTATEYPNQWVVTYDGFYFFLRNRIGSDYNYYFNHIENIIEEIKSIPMENEDHFVRIRSVYFDDKHFSYVFYLDYMYPNSDNPCISSAKIQEFLGDGYAKEDGRFYQFDVRTIPYFKGSDHFDPDHYDYYVPYDSYYKEGKERFRTEQEETEYYNGKEHLNSINENNRVVSFNRLENLFRNLDFLKVTRAVNCTIENLDRFYFQADWTKLLDDQEYEQERFFSAWFLFTVHDDEKFHQFISCLPQSVEHSFRLTQVQVYVPNNDKGSILVDEKNSKLYEFTVYVHPYNVKNKYIGRQLINNSFNIFSNAIEKHLNKQ